MSRLLARSRSGWAVPLVALLVFVAGCGKNGTDGVFPVKGEVFVEGIVTYVAGSAPAWSTEAWVRTSRGYYQAAIGFVAPGASRQFRALLHKDEANLRCPFSEFKKLRGNEIGWVGVTWNGPSYYVVRRHRLGRALMHTVSRALSEGTLSPTRASQILGVKPRSVSPLLDEAFGGRAA